MSAIKNYIENLSVICSRAYVEEVEPYMNETFGCNCHTTFFEANEWTAEYLFSGKAEDVFSTLYAELSDIEIDLILIRMPQTLLACSLLIPFLSEETRLDYDLPKTEAEFISEILS